MPLNFRRHFPLLAAALLLVVALNAANYFPEPYLPSFAIYGALHAGALVLSLPAPARAARKILFLAAAAASNVAVLYLGIVTLEALAGVLAELRLYLSLGVCAVAGALGYGLLIRWFFMPALRPRAIVQIAAGCCLATLLALGLENQSAILGSWALVAAWWFAFSLGLWRIQRRIHLLRPQTHPE